jgi:DNA polymerase-1
MDETSVDRHLNAVMEADIVAVDTETTGLDGIKDGRDYFTGISIAYRLGALGILTAYFPFNHEGSGNLDKRYLTRIVSTLSNKPLIWHHRKFDSHSVRTAGIDPAELMRKRQFDVMMEAQLLNENWPSKELDWLSKVVLKEGKGEEADEAAKWGNVFGWGTVPIDIMEKRARIDTDRTLRLHEALWPKLEAEGLDQLWDAESAFTDVLRKMESEGVGVRTDFAEAKLRQGRARMADIEEQLDLKPTNANIAPILFDELGFPVLERSEKTGKPSLNKKVMEEYDLMLQASGNPLAELVLEYRGWQTACGLLYEPTLRLLSPDGRIRTNYKQHGTVTSRLSSAGPNMQQIPRKGTKEWNGDAKTMFTAGCDCCDIWGFDYSQLEFRFSAAYGGEPWLIKTFSDPDADVFTSMSERIGAPRQVCKTFTYANLYGAGLEKIAYTLGKKPHEIEDLYANFIDSISHIKSASRRATRLAEQRKYVRYWTGRRRHFAYNDDGYHKAFNSLLQGGAAELVKHAMLACREVEDNSAHGDCRMVLQVHDEIVFRIRRGTIDKYRPEIVERMTGFPQFGIPLAVEGKIWNA